VNAKPLSTEEVGLAELFEAQRIFHEAQRKTLNDHINRVHKAVRWSAFATGFIAATLVVTVAALVLLYEQRSSDRAHERDRQLQAVSTAVLTACNALADERLITRQNCAAAAAAVSASK
jgi:hypothetical protein